MSNARRPQKRPVVAATSRPVKTEYVRSSAESMELQRRVERMEAEMSALSIEVNGAVRDIASMRASQEGMVAKIDKMLTAVTTLEASRPPDLLATASTVFNMVAKGVTIFSLIVGGIIYLINNNADSKAPEKAAFVIIDGQKHRVTQ